MVEDTSTKVGGPMGDVSNAAAAVKALCSKVSAMLDAADTDGLVRLTKIIDPVKVENLLRSQINAGILPDILRDL